MSFFETYHFFTLSLLLGIPAWTLVFSRSEFRRQAVVLAFLAAPFALTERFFVPEYWAPRFVGPLFFWIGAGLEDFLLISAVFVASTLAQVHAIAGSAAAMAVGVLCVILHQPALRRDALLGLLATGSVYFGVCLLYQRLYPMDFSQMWRTDGLTQVRVLGVPLAEIIYGMLAGALGATVIPFAQLAPTRYRKDKGEKR